MIDAFGVTYAPFPGKEWIAATVAMARTYSTKWNDYDDSFQILLFSVLSFVIRSR